MSKFVLSYITRVAVIANFERQMFLDFLRGWTLAEFQPLWGILEADPCAAKVVIGLRTTLR